MAILDYLVANAEEVLKQKNKIKSIGLINGKMGFCINLYHIAKITGDNSILNKANDLLDEVYSLTKVSSNLGFSKGILGIGWGIEYLAQEKFVHADTHEVLESLDQRLFARKFFSSSHEHNEFPALLDLGNYFIKRLQNPESNDNILSILMIKQNIIGVLEQLDWGKGLIIQNGQIKHPINTSKLLSPMLLFLKDMHVLDIYNTRIDKMLSWVIPNLEKNIPGSAIGKLEVLAALIKLRNECPSLLKINDLINLVKNGIAREELESEVKEFKNGSYLSLLKNYSSIAAENEYAFFFDDLIFWKKRLVNYLNTISTIATDDPLADGVELGLLNGFDGLYSIFPILNNDLKMRIVA